MANLPAAAPLLWMPADLFQTLHQVLGSYLPGPEAAYALRGLGSESGASVHEALRELIAQNSGVEDTSALEADRFWNSLADLLENLGWGEIEFERLHPGVGSLVSANWIEADREASQPSCHFTTGLLADVLRRVAGTDLAVLEVECRSTGHSTCRFVFGGPEPMGRIHEELRAGRSYEEAVERLG